jgi:hypothetical protein
MRCSPTARGDDRITGAAQTGSAAAGAEDRSSDIDLSLGVGAEADLGQALAGWTGLMYQAPRSWRWPSRRGTDSRWRT